MASQNATELILRGLNDEQCDAVCHGDGPLLIVAGAGTGKTKTLVHRVAHLIQRGVPPSRILLLTFTRQSAAEMIRRVDGLLTKVSRNHTASRQVWGGTFTRSSRASSVRTAATSVWIQTSRSTIAAIPRTCWT